MGGMWGYKKNNHLNINFNSILDNFLTKRSYNFKRMDDMLFLDEIYYIIDDKYIMTHDNYFKKNKDVKPIKSFNNDTTHFIGEIYDQYNKPIYWDRDKNLIKD